MFKVGDVIVYNNKLYRICSIDCQYYLKSFNDSIYVGLECVKDFTMFSAK